MRAGIFGWDLPPGCSLKDIDEAMGDGTGEDEDGTEDDDGAADDAADRARDDAHERKD